VCIFYFKKKQILLAFQEIVNRLKKSLDIYLMLNGSGNKHRELKQERIKEEKDFLR